MPRSFRLGHKKFVKNFEGDSTSNICLKLASFKGEQRPDRSNAARYVGAAVLAQVARSGRSDAALR